MMLCIEVSLSASPRLTGIVLIIVSDSTTGYSLSRVEIMASLSFFISYLNQRVLMNYTFLSTTSALICDYFLMLPLEIKLIWFSKWTYTKVIFLLIRYTAFIGVALLLHDQMAPNLSIAECKITYPIAISLLTMQTWLAQAIFSIRTWAVWRGNRVVGVGLGCLTLGSIVTQCITIVMFIGSVRYASSPYPDFGGCFIAYYARNSSSTISFTVVEAAILMLMAISAIRSYRQGNKNKLTLVIHRDAILFYVFTLGISLMLLIPFPPLIVWSLMAYAIYSALTARMILNMRRVGNLGMETELHDGSSVSSIIPGRMRFAPNDHPHERTISEMQPSRILEDPNCIDKRVLL